MSPEERASELFKSICRMGKIELGHNPTGEAEATALIAQAIRQAENEAYELAAEQASGGRWEDYYANGTVETYWEEPSCAEIKKRILALIDDEDDHEADIRSLATKDP